ncbi:MAG: tetratricopeptide repeat protein [Acidobacteriia bacterium]|nr:tetratricopeptide repeat protein [Terriglobia bacterium]
MKKTFAGLVMAGALCAAGALVVVAREGGPTPLGQTKLLALVAGNALPENVVQEINRDGLSFHPDDAYRSLLKNAGADATVLKALNDAKVVVADGREDSADKGQLQHLSDAGRLIKDKRDDEAAEELAVVLKGSFESPESGFVMGQVLRQEEGWAQAVAVYTEVLREDPNFPEAHTKLSYVLYRGGDNEAALSEARASLNARPDNAEAHKNAGLALAAMRKFDASLSEYKEAIRIKPDYEAVHLDLGIMYDEKGDWKDAAVEYKKALALNPSDTDARYNYALSLDRSGDLASAILQYREAKRLSPERYDIRQNLGAILMNNGQNAESVIEFRELVKLYPDTEMCRASLGMGLFRVWDFPGAEAEFRKAMELDPSEPIPHMGIGDIREEQKNYDAALEEFNKAIALDESFVDGYRGAVRVLIKKGDFVKASEQARTAETIAPSDSNIHELYGQALEGTGNHDGAIAEFKESIALDSKQISVMLELADAFQKKGDWAGALDVYRKAALADASIDFRTKVMPSGWRDPQKEYKAAQTRFEQHITDLKSAGRSPEAAALEKQVQAAQSSSSLSEKLDEEIQASAKAAAQRHFDEAMVHDKEAVAIAEKMQPHDPRLITALDRLGMEYVQQNPAAATAAFERELAVAEELYGPQSPFTAEPLQSLGRNALYHRDYATAEKFYFRAVDVNEKVFGESSDRVANSLVIAASVYLAQQQYEKAEPYLLRAARIDESLYGKDNVDMLLPLASLCYLYDKSNKPEKAEPCYHQTLTIVEKQYGSDSPVLASTLTQEEKALRSLGRTADADEVDRRLASIRAATMSPN